MRRKSIFLTQLEVDFILTQLLIDYKNVKHVFTVLIDIPIVY